jgi:hypothetical protein
VISFTRRFASIEPTVRQCESGQWLATSDPRDPIRVGATGQSEEEARRFFAEEVRAFANLLDEPPEGRL